MVSAAIALSNKYVLHLVGSYVITSQLLLHNVFDSWLLLFFICISYYVTLQF